MARVNPSLPNDQAQYNPVHRVTGLFDSHDAVTAALCDLEEAGFAREDIDILAGAEGEHVLDPLRPCVDHGPLVPQARGLGLGYVEVPGTGRGNAERRRLRRRGEAWRGGPEGRAMDILTQHGARDVKYWATWYVEQGHEDEPRQNLKRDDQ